MGWTGRVRFPVAPRRSDRLWGAASFLWVEGAFSPRLKQQRREADHSDPSGAQIKNVGAIPPLPRISLRVA